jgi:hypothetical protein
MISAMNIFGESWTDRNLYFLSTRVDRCVDRLHEKIDGDFKLLDKWSESRTDRLEKRMEREFARFREDIRELRKG